MHNVAATRRVGEAAGNGQDGSEIFNLISFTLYHTHTNNVFLASTFSMIGVLKD